MRKIIKGYAITSNSLKGKSIECIIIDGSLIEESIDNICRAYGLDEIYDRDIFEVETVDIYIDDEENYKL